MSGVANAVEKTPQYCKYATVKVDEELLFLLKAAAALDKKSTQEWLSDLVNEAAAKRTGEKPVKRKPPKPRPRVD